MMAGMPLLPLAFQDLMRQQLGADADALFQALEQPPVQGLRLNSNKISQASFSNISPFTLEPVPWCQGAFISKNAHGKHPFHAAGLYYLQDPSAMAVVESLDPKPGELVIDLAAAPGGKSTHILSKLRHEGLLIANEVNTTRSHALLQNLERWGARNAVVTRAPISLLAKRWGGIFDRVLLDAPCSGEGMFRKSAEARQMWTPEHVQSCSRLQTELLGHAASLVKAGGQLLYSTCTFNKEENEQVIEHFISRHKDFQVEQRTLAGIGSQPPEQVQHNIPGIKLFPHKVSGEGHSLFILTRKALENHPGEQAMFHPLPDKISRLWRDLQQDLGVQLNLKPLTMFGNKLFAVPQSVPNLRQIKALRAGVHLASLQGKRLLPAQGLALALSQKTAKSINHLNYDQHDPMLERYMTGHVLSSKGDDGWLLIMVEGFVLGWARRKKQEIKNYYPKGLRFTPEGS